jgi:glucose/arabinose dehydrogenase
MEPAGTRIAGWCIALFLVATSLSAAVPARFTDSLVTAILGPTAIAFTPDGRLLITTQGGTLRVFAAGGLLPTAALTIPANQICSNSERGLLGVTVDPAFADNHFIYLFYTRPTPTGTCPTTGLTRPVNRVSRFTLPDTNVVDPMTEMVLVDNMPSPAGNHNAGDVQFGRDGYLYISIGDGGCDYANNSGCAGSNDAARDQHVLTGKILRITSAGGIPPTNPFQGAGTARCNVTGMTTPGNRCQETFAWGLRNPFRFAFDPNNAGTRFFINDVGQGLWEEIDLGQSGADYGWNCREGAHANSTSGPCSPAPPGMVDPIFEYRHGLQVPATTSPTNCNSITGGAFVPNGLWPGFDGKYLFADFVCGWIFQLTDNGGGSFAAADFATGLGNSSAVALRFGPHGSTQALYYTTYAAGGQVRRIVRDNPVGNDPPTAIAAASPISGPVPLNVTFDATGSSDPDAGDTLTYFWDFGDGTPETATSSLTIPHNYTSAGVFTVSLRARDDNFAFSSPVTLQVQPGNTPPSPSMASPALLATFAVGQTITLTGSATDTQDGTLPASGLSWQVLLHHNNDHTHPFLGPLVGNNIQFVAPSPEDLAAAANSYLEVILTATDSGGLATVLARDVQPRQVDLTLASDPPGLALALNGAPITAPQTVTSWEGYAIAVSAANQSDGMGGSYVFLDWSDGGEAAHSLMTPATDATITARFRLSEDSGAMRYYTVPPCRALDTRLPNGPLGGPALSAGSSRDIALTGDVCMIPVEAVAIAANFTVVQPAATGVLRAFPASDAATATSVLAVRPGLTRASNAVVGLDAATTLTLLLSAPTGTAHVVLDILGYFAPLPPG